MLLPGDLPGECRHTPLNVETNFASISKLRRCIFIFIQKASDYSALDISREVTV